MSLNKFTPQEALNIPISGKWVPLFKDNIGGSGDTNSYNIDVSDYHQVAITNSNAGGALLLFTDSIGGSGVINGFHEMSFGNKGTNTFEVPQLGPTIYLHIRYTSSTTNTDIWIVGI